MMTSFDNNEDKVCLLLKDDVGGSYIRSRAKSYDLGSHDYGVTLVKQLKQALRCSYFQTISSKLSNNKALVNDKISFCLHKQRCPKLPPFLIPCFYWPQTLIPLFFHLLAFLSSILL